MAIGLLITALLITIYSRTAATSAEFQRTNSQIENGRFALQLLQQELMHAGFWGEFVPPATVPTATVNPCLAWVDWAAADKTNFFHLPLQGYDNPATSSALPTGCSTPLPGLVPGSDVLVVRHSETCLAGVGGCEAVNADKLYLQVSLCANQTPDYEFGRSADGAAFTRQIRTCTDPAAANPAAALRAGKRKFISHIYYVRTVTQNGKTIPVLARSEFDNESGVVIARTAETLVEDIENFQVEYALDTSGDDGIADGAYTTCSACTAAQWNQVVAVRVSVLARSSSTSPGYAAVDTKSYTLGSADPICSTNGTCTNKVLVAGYKRHVYSLVVRLVNPATRKPNAP